MPHGGPCPMECDQTLVEYRRVTPDESQDPSADLANVNAAYRLEHEEVDRLRTLLGEVMSYGAGYIPSGLRNRIHTVLEGSSDAA